jgi:hypothetical protein
MIQRIQSIFLAVAGVLSFGLFGVPFASTGGGVTSSSLFADGMYNLHDNVALLVFFCIAGGLAIIDIFLFKNRPLQIRLGMFAFIANIIGLILGVVLFIQDGIMNAQGVEVDDGIGVYLPIVAGVFLLLAIRAIRKDDALVKSADRLR